MPSGIEAPVTCSSVMLTPKPRSFSFNPGPLASQEATDAEYGARSLFGVTKDMFGLLNFPAFRLQSAEHGSVSITDN